jgi:two-component system OmpR family sensor kinase
MGLRWRLAGGVAGAMLLMAVVIFVIVYDDTGTQLESQIDRGITAAAGQLSQALRPFRRDTPLQFASAARRYVRAQPYAASSTLLLTIIPGASIATNHPELFAAVRPDHSETVTEQDQENAEARNLLRPHIGYSTQLVPDVGRVRILERSVPVGRVTAIVGAGEPLGIVQSAQRGIAKAFVLAGALTVVFAVLVAYLAAVRISGPLRRMAAVAARVDAGDLERRMPTPVGHNNEVYVLADAFNRMLDRLAEAFAGQREFVADASHELRTPITVIRGQLELLAALAHPSVDDVRRVERLVQGEITRISRLVDDLLLLAQAERTDFLRPRRIDLRPFVSELWDGISLTASRRFELGTIPSGTVVADPDRVAQALRNLSRNAIEHTADETGLVRLEIDQLADPRAADHGVPLARRRTAPGRIRFTVLDDGPGIPVSERERIFERFHRTDSARSRNGGGAGLGLAIVRAIAEAHGGQVHADNRPDGTGARLELVLPGFTAG